MGCRWREVVMQSDDNGATVPAGVSRAVYGAATPAKMFRRSLLAVVDK